MKISILLACLFLTACDTLCVKPDPEVTIRYKYVINEIPSEMLSVPPQVESINPDTATDKEAAIWMVNSENRATQIEDKLKAIKKYQEDKLKNLSYPQEDIIKN